MVKYLLPNEGEDKEPILNVHLERDEDNVILVVGGYYVAGLISDGELELYSDLPDDIGLKATGAGYIKVTR